ncbi:MAG: ArnT family glycosyltransferase [Candidatus Woesearchaeota archaeon]
MKNNFLKKYWIFILLFLITTFYLQFIFSGSLLLWDEPVYLGNARSHITTSNFTEDFRFPLLEYFIAFIWLLFGESIISAQILMILFSLLTIYVFYLISKQFFKEDIYVFLSTFLFAFSSTLLFWSYRVYTDIPSLCFMLLAILFFLKFLKERKEYQLFLSGIFTSLSFLMRFSAVLFSFIIISYLGIMLIKQFLKNKNLFYFKSMIFYALGNLLILTPWMLYNYLKYKNPLWDLMTQSSVIAEYTTWQSPLLFLKDIYLELGLSLLLILFYLLYFLDKNQKKEFKDYFLLILIVLTLCFHLFYIRLKLTRYVLMISPFLFLALVIGLKYLFSKINFKFIKIILVTLIIFNSLLIANDKIYSMNEQINCEKDGAFYNSIDYAMKNIPEDKTIVSNSWPWYGYYGNHKVFSFWNDNLTMFIEKYNTSSFIYVQNGGLEINQKILDDYDAIYLEKTFKDDCNQQVFIYSIK